MRKRPLLLAACIFVIGILAAYYEFYYAGIAGVVLVYAIEKLLRERRYGRMLVRTLLLISIFLLSFFRTNHILSFYEFEQSQIVEGEILTLQGEIYKKEIKNMQQYYYLKDCVALVQANQNTTNQAEQIYVPCNKVRISMEGDTYPIGQTLVLYGQVHSFKKATNEGQFDMQWHFRCQQIDFSLEVFRVQFSDGEKDGIREGLYQFRGKVRTVYNQAMNYGSGILSTMLLGDQAMLDSEVKDLYQSAGISHILAISGLHVSMIGLSLYRFLRKRRRSFLRSSVLSFVLLCLYALMTGGSISTSRALGMVGLTLVATVLGQGYDMLNGLGFMILVLLIENPMLLWYSGFQFSVVALLGIGVLGAGFAMEARTPGKPNLLERMRNALFGSLTVWLATLPLVAYYYYEISTYSMLLNLLILPLLKVIFAFGIAGGLAGLWVLGLGKIALFPCSVLLRLYDVLARFFLRLPGSQMVVGKPSPWRIVIYYVLLLGLAGILHSRKQKQKEQERECGIFDYGIRFVATVILIAIIFVPSPKKYEIDILDVGQGDGVYFCTGEACMFLDGGSIGNTKIGEYTILPFLKSKGVKAIDYWFVSHADKDHVRGLEYAITDGYKVRNIVIAKPQAKLAEEGLDENMASLLALAKEHKVSVIYMEAGDKIAFSHDLITCLYPQAEDYSSDANDLCLVFTYEHKDESEDSFKGMFAGDISSNVEREIVRRYEDNPSLLAVDYYKTNHHGSRYSNCEEWLDALSPKYATISCGKDNSYGHPHVEAVDRIRNVGCSFDVTAEVGEIRLVN